MNFETTPRGDHRQARTADYPQNRRADRFELGLEGKFAAKSSGWEKNRAFLEGDKLEVAVKARDRRPNCAMLFSGRLKRR
jgi:hypothetical protein